jgi:hypothetical protein
MVVFLPSRDCFIVEISSQFAISESREAIVRNIVLGSELDTIIEDRVRSGFLKRNASEVSLQSVLFRAPMILVFSA